MPTTTALSYTIIIVFLAMNLRKDDQSTSRTRFVLLRGNAYRKLPGIVLDRRERGAILQGISIVSAIWTTDQFWICFTFLPFPGSHALIPKADLFESSLFSFQWQVVFCTAVNLSQSLGFDSFALQAVHCLWETVQSGFVLLGAGLTLGNRRTDEIEVRLAWELCCWSHE